MLEAFIAIFIDKICCSFFLSNQENLYMIIFKLFFHWLCFIIFNIIVPIKTIDAYLLVIVFFFIFEFKKAYDIWLFCFWLLHYLCFKRISFFLMTLLSMEGMEWSGTAQSNQLKKFENFFYSFPKTEIFKNFHIFKWKQRSLKFYVDIQEQKFLKIVL